jgi:hypothetical protein
LRPSSSPEGDLAQASGRSGDAVEADGRARVRARGPNAAAALRREEKELRAEERTTLRMAGLEGEVARLAKALDASVLGHKPVAPGAVWRSRTGAKPVRTRNAELKDLRDAHALTVLEAGKWACERETFDERVVGLEQDLEKAAAATHSALEDRKQKNIMLEATLDRLRFEMDEVQTTAAEGRAARTSRARRQRRAASGGDGAEDG